MNTITGNFFSLAPADKTQKWSEQNGEC